MSNVSETGDLMSDLQESAASVWSAVAGAWEANAAYVDDHTADATTAMLDRLAVEPGDRLLELASGPGTLGTTLADLVGPSGEVLLSDLAPGMVEVARRRSAALDNVRCAVLDAASIDQPDESFDVVVSRMGVMFVPDPATALGEIRRVLAVGGRFGVMTWAGMEHNPWMTSVGMAAMLAGIATGGPPVGPGSIFSLGDPDQLRQLAIGAGFRDVTVDVADVVFRAPDVETHVARVGSLAGPLAALIEAASDEQRAAMRKTAGELAAPYETANGVKMPGRVVVAAGRR